MRETFYSSQSLGESHDPAGRCLKIENECVTKRYFASASRGGEEAG